MAIGLVIDKNSVDNGVGQSNPLPVRIKDGVTENDFDLATKAKQDELIAKFVWDGITNSLRTVDYPHHEIHSGSHFFYCDAITLADTVVQDYLITTPNSTKFAHMVLILDGSSITQFQIFEGSDKTGTTAQTVFNSNRNSATTPTVTVHKAVSGGTTDGTSLCMYKSGSSTNQSRSGAGVRSEDEIILKANTKYIIRVTSGAAANLVNVRFVWYEHINL